MPSLERGLQLKFRTTFQPIPVYALGYTRQKWHYRLYVNMGTTLQSIIIELMTITKSGFNTLVRRHRFETGLRRNFFSLFFFSSLILDLTHSLLN